MEDFKSAGFCGSGIPCTRKTRQFSSRRACPQNRAEGFEAHGKLPESLRELYTRMLHALIGVGSRLDKTDIVARIAHYDKYSACNEVGRG